MDRYEGGKDLFWENNCDVDFFFDSSVWENCEISVSNQQYNAEQ